MDTRLSPAVLLALAYSVLVGAWVFTNPPGASPDEPAHLVRARATGSGDWTGRPAAYPITPEFGPRQLPWINEATRSFAVSPASVFPTIATCNAFHPEISSACLEESLAGPRAPARPRSYVASYQPFLYWPIGVAANASRDPAGGLVLGRIVVAVMSALLVAVAIAALWRPREGAWPLVGPLVAVSPMVIFLAASLSPNGVEITGGLALFAIAVRLARQEDDGRWWVAFGVCAAVVALSRPVAPLWVVAAAAVFVTLLGPRRARIAARRCRGAAIAGAAIATAGVAASVAWGLTYSPPPATAERSASVVLRAFSQLPELLRQMIGVFGWLDTALPAAAYAAWRLLVVVLVTLAVVVAARAQRIAILGAAVGTVVIAVVLAVFVIFPSGFGMQGRYILPLAVALPLLAGDALEDGRRRLYDALPRRFPLGVASVVAVVHAVAWWANARRHAVGVRGPIQFVGRGQWSPSGGWAPWVVVVGGGCALIVLAAIAAERSSSSAVAAAGPSNE